MKYLIFCLICLNLGFTNVSEGRKALMEIEALKTAITVKKQYPELKDTKFYIEKHLICPRSCYIKSQDTIYYDIESSFELKESLAKFAHGKSSIDLTSDFEYVRFVVWHEFAHALQARRNMFIFLPDKKLEDHANYWALKHMEES